MHSVGERLDLIKSADYGHSKITSWSIRELRHCGNESINNGDLNVSSQSLLNVGSTVKYFTRIGDSSKGSKDDVLQIQGRVLLKYGGLMSQIIWCHLKEI